MLHTGTLLPLGFSKHNLDGFQSYSADHPICYAQPLVTPKSQEYDNSSLLRAIDLQDLRLQIHYLIQVQNFFPKSFEDIDYRIERSNRRSFRAV
jgi:hypothetical protein